MTLTRSSTKHRVVTPAFGTLTRAKRRRSALIAAGGLAALLLAVCGEEESPAVTPPPPTSAAATPETPAPTITVAVISTTTPSPPSSAPSTIAPTTSTEPGPGPFKIKVDVDDGVPEGDGRVVVERGTEIELTVTADTSDEVHVHFYDFKADVTPADAALIRFVADVPGIYEIEMENSHLLLLELEVR